MISFKLDLCFLICLIFCAYNLQILVNDGRKFVYQNSELDVNRTHFSLCAVLDTNSYNCSKLDQIANRSKHDACLKMRNLSLDFSSSTFNPKEIIDQAKLYKIDEFFSFLDRIKNPKVTYYLNLQSICVAYFAENLKKEIDEPTYINIPIINHFSIESKIIFHSEHPYPLVTRGYSFECVQFEYCPYFKLTIKMYDLELLPAPFSSNCVDYAKLKFKFEKNEKIRTRSDCLMECMKSYYRLSLFYYSENDKDVLKFNPNFPISKELNDNYRICLSTCSNSDCFSKNFFVFGYKHDNEANYSVVRHHYQVMNYKAIPYLFRYTYALQFLGFITLVFGTSIFTMLSKLEAVFKTNLALKNILKLKDRLVSWAKRSIFIISLAIGFALEFQYCRDFKSELNYSHIFRAYTPIYPTKFTAILCYNISICLDKDTRLENTTLKHLESLPDCDFKVLSRSPIAKFEDYEREVRVIREKSIYRTISKEGFFKCFSVNLKITEPRYRSILFGTNVLINMTNVYKLYLVDYMGRLDYETKFFRIGFKIKHVTNEIRTFSNCTDYNFKENRCESQNNCVDKCYLKEFLKKYNTLPFHSIIYAEYFRKDKNIKLNTSFDRDDSIWSDCLDRYRIPDCDHVTITTHDKQIGNNFVKKGEILNLNLLIEHTANTLILLTNQREVVFHWLTLGSVLFGLSYPKLIDFLIGLCKFKHFNFLKGKKVIFAISILGSIYHTYNILDDTINSDMIPQYENNFDFLKPNKHIPVLVFCVEHKVKLDGPTITGRELDKKASYIKNNDIFEKIVYYDLEFNKKTWFPNHTNPENMIIDYFFLNKYKCYQIIYRLTYHNLYSTYAYNILTISMNSTLDNYLFSYRTNLSYNLVDYFILEKDQSYYCNWDYFSETINDKYQAFKNPMLLFQKSLKRYEVKNYIDDLKEEFRQKFNYTTTLVPLLIEDQDLDREIRNDLFEDLIRYDVEPRESKQPDNNDYKRTYFNLLITYNKEPINNMIYIKKIFFYGDLKMTNKDDYLNLLVNLLNCLSVWFNLSLMNLAYAFSSLRFYFKRLLLSKLGKNKIKGTNEEQKLVVLKKTDQKTNLILIDKNQVYYLK